METDPDFLEKAGHATAAVAARGERIRERWQRFADQLRLVGEYRRS